jgi:CheY-like chemotaxis protein
MASGIAHDFNNTLTPILGYTELLLDSRNLGEDKTRRYLTLMNTAAKDAGNIVRRLREFYRARDQQEPLREVLLNELVEQAIVLTRPRWRDQALAHGAAIRVEKDLREVPMVAVVEAEIRELLTNLIFNAVDAMPQGGSIALRTRPDGERVTLEVADTGTGMSEEVRRRCLEPFFSTKGERGTGLGLAMVYGIVQRHGGTLHIESEPGHGTTFVIQLPASTRGSAGPAAQDGARTRRALSVLLVDDDREAREVLVAYLAADGHTVHAAADGREAWKAFQRGRFDLVIADRVMPHMSGDQLTVAIKQAAPTVPVVLLSGFTEFHGDVAETAHVADAALSKPITLGALRQVVAQCVGDHDLPLTPIPTA